MTTPAIVIDEQQQRYRLRTQIGRGATGEVWSAERIALKSATGEPKGAAAFVVKLALPDTDPDLFNDEVEVLQQLRSHVSGAVVWASKATVQTDPDRPALVMEEVRDEWRIFRQQLNETTMLELATRYVRLLDALHTHLRRTANDRKIDDIYWYAEQKRLIVLDWNVTKKYTEETEQYQREVRGDLRIFAGFWYETLVRAHPTTLPAVDNTTAATPEPWRQLRRGTRRLISQARSNRSGQRYETAAQFLGDIEWFSQRFARDATRNLAEAEQCAAQADADTTMPQHWERIKDLLDLVEHRKPSPEQADRVRALRERMQQVAQEQADHVQSALHQAREALNNGYPKRAQSALAETTRLKNLSVEQGVQLQRWLALSTTLQECERQRISTSEMRPELIGIVNELDVAVADEQRRQVWQRIETCVSEPGSQVPALKPVADFLWLLQQEIEIRQTYQPAVETHQRADTMVGGERQDLLEQANQHYQAVTQQLNTLEQAAPAYGTALRTMLADLPDRHQEISAELARIAQQAATRQELEATTTKISLLLQTASQNSPYQWPAELSELLNTVSPHTQPHFFHLKQVADHLQQGHYRAALDKVRQLQQSAATWEPSEIALALVSNIILEYVRTVPQRPPFYRDKIIEAIELLDRLPGEHTFFKEEDQQIQNLRELSKWQSTLYSRIFPLDDIAQNPNNPERQKALEQAKQANLEFFRAEEQSVSRLLDLIEKARLTQVTQEFENIDLAQLRAEVASQLQQWQAVREGMATAHASADIATTFEQIKTTLESLKARIAGLEDWRDQMQTLLPQPQEQMEQHPGPPMEISQPDQVMEQHAGPPMEISQPDQVDDSEHVWQQVIAQWQSLAKPSQQGYPKPPPDLDLLEQTTRLLGETPSDMHVEDRQELCKVLIRSYQMMAKEDRAFFTSEKCLYAFVWVGILSSRYTSQMQEADQKTPPDQDPEKLLKMVISLIRKRRDNSEGFHPKQLAHYFKRLASYEPNPRVVTERIMDELGENNDRKSSGTTSAPIMIAFILLSILSVGLGGFALAGVFLFTSPIHLETVVDTQQLDANSQETAIITATLSRRFGRSLVERPEVAFFVLPPDAGTITRLENADTGVISARFTPGRQPVEQVSVLVQAEEQLETVLLQIVGVPSLRTAMETQPGPGNSVVPGQTITATFSLSNTGTTVLEDARLVVTLPPGLSLANTADAAWQAADKQILRSLNPLAPDDLEPRILELPLEVVEVDPNFVQDRELGDLEYVVATADEDNLIEATGDLALTVVAPVVETIELAVEPNEWLADGTSVVTLTARAYDQAGNPVPDGTEIQFRLEPELEQREAGSSDIPDLSFRNVLITETLTVTPTRNIRTTTAALQLIPSDVITRTTVAGTAVYTTTAGTLPVAINMVATANDRSADQLVTQQPCGRVNSGDQRVNVRTTAQEADNFITTLPAEIQLNQVCAEEAAATEGWTRVILTFSEGVDTLLLMGWVSETTVEILPSPTEENTPPEENTSPEAEEEPDVTN